MNRTLHKKKIPLKFTGHISKEFFNSLIIFTSIIFILITITNFVEELFFLKEIKFDQNIYIYSFFFTMIKFPSMLINLFPFIFLFASIHFFVKIIRNNEYLTLKISGVSNLFIILVPSIFSFFLGVFLILVFSPIGSVMTKHYENTRKNITGNDNLIFVNENGVWIKETKNDKNVIIIRAEKFYKFKNTYNLKKISIFENDSDGKLLKTIIAESAEIINEYWILNNATSLNIDQGIKQKNNKLNFFSKIRIQELENFFSNPDTFSVWNIIGNINTFKERGYFGDELIIKFHKFISFPFLLFSTVILATVFTININQRYDNYIYSFFGVISGIVIYFLIDLSIAFGKTGRIPLSISVWAPIILILILCWFSLIRSNEN